MIASLLHKNFSTEKNQRERLALLSVQLRNCCDVSQKLEVLSSDVLVNEYLKEGGPLSSCLEGLSPECELVVKAVIAAGQAETLFSFEEGILASGLRNLLNQLLPIEKFYEEAGGIVGYQEMMLALLSKNCEEPLFHENYLTPEGLEISHLSPVVKGHILDGIVHLENVAEIYPVGGAADRLQLYDEKTGIALPAARLKFGGKSLLQGMVEDLQAREFLHFKLFNKQLTTPIAMMTSQEKDNHAQVRAICSENKWFGRGEENFRFFCQPLVPTIDVEGNWCLQGPMQLLLKPGGHGVIWKLARDEGVFDWFKQKGRSKVFARQINNPIAGTDYGILAFTGIGCSLDKTFGFASCPRVVRAQEGIDVLIENKKTHGFEYILTNIEYSDFKKYQVVDEPSSPDSPYSKFPSNTNLLFADLSAVETAVEHFPFPGRIVNFKKTIFRNEAGELKEEVVARLETMMQNIADFFVETSPERLQKDERCSLKTYITFNLRRKTISTAKKAHKSGESFLETPEGCFLDHIENMRELLIQHCGFELPNGFFVFYCHPSLGPLYAIIGQKIYGGFLEEGSELQLEIADVSISQLHIEGSLLIKAHNVMGEIENCYLNYSNQTGKCTLRNVIVVNRGIDLDAHNIYWKNEISRLESCQIILEGNGEFYAEDVVLEGPITVVVKNGMRVIAVNTPDGVVFKEEATLGSSWSWKYFVNEEDLIEVRHIENGRTY